MARAFLLATVLLVGLLALACGGDGDDEPAPTSEGEPTARTVEELDEPTETQATEPTSTPPAPTETEPPPATNTPVPTDTPPPPVTNRRSCTAIRGTSYLSEDERQWFQANCITPTATRIPIAVGCGAPQNPWGYDFCPGGARISSPPPNFCSYFACIGNFWNGRGYVIQCRDAMFGKSGGIQGSCSHHGGNSRALLSY